MAIIYKVGALSTDTPSNILVFQTYFAGATDRVSHLRLAFTTTAYIVTPGKTLYLVQFVDDGSFSQTAYKIGYCDNDVGYGTSTARVNPVMSIGVDNASMNGLGLQGYSSNAGSSPRDADMCSSLIKVAISQKYPFVRRVGFGSGYTAMLYGIEL